MSIDKVVIEGAEFTRVAERYLLQSEVERALAQLAAAPSEYIQSLTQLLEDLVTMANQMTLEIADLRRGSASGPIDDSGRQTLEHVRDALSDQIALIDGYLAEEITE